MKKTLFVLAPSLMLAAAAHADNFDNTINTNNKGIYVSANANFARTEMPFDSVDADLQPLERSGFTPAIALGYDFGPVRSEINYEDLGTLTSSDPYIKGNLKVKNVGITTVYNFRHQADIQPYVGGRVMYTQFKADDQLTQSLAEQGIELKSNHMGLGVVGGVEYKVIDNLLVGVNANWDLLSGDPANSLGGGLTLRAKF